SVCAIGYDYGCPGLLWGDYMRRAAIIATIVTSTLAFSSFSLAASDEEIGHAADKMRGAFRCSIYAGTFNDLKESNRLFEIGLKAGRDFVEGMKSRNDPATEYMRGMSTDFMVGSMWQMETTKADDEIRKYYDGRRPDVAKTEAERSYRNGNCSLIK